MSGGRPVTRVVVAVATVLSGALVLVACQRQDASVCAPWPAWESYKVAFLNPDGRIVADPDGRSHSEGQAYALMFALVANDRAAFAQILRWTEDNLAAGDLTARLPAWHWGQREDQSWGVIDANAAADADLWIAYALNEAARLWGLPQHAALSELLAQRILREETATLPGLGLTLLPGPVGFVQGDSAWRLNPSYLPIPLLRRLHAADPGAGWDRIVASAVRVITDSAPRGFAPDWTHYAGGRFAPDEQTAAAGSYDAIRVYLWAGLMSENDPDRRALLSVLRPMAEQVEARGLPPERIDTVTGEARGDGPVGFSAALVPFLEATGHGRAARTQARRIVARSAATPPGYFDQSLILFGTGWSDGRYRIDADGALQPRWHQQCPASA